MAPGACGNDVRAQHTQHDAVKDTELRRGCDQVARAASRKSGANRRGNCTSGAENTALTLPTRTPQGNETPALARLRGHDPSFPRGNRADMAAVSTNGGEAFAKRILDLECRRVVWHGASDGDSTRTGADSSRWQLCLSLDGPYPISPDFDHAVPTMYDHIARDPAAMASPVWLWLAARWFACWFACCRGFFQEDGFLALETVAFLQLPDVYLGGSGGGGHEDDAAASLVDAWPAPVPAILAQDIGKPSATPSPDAVTLQSCVVVYEHMPMRRADGGAHAYLACHPWVFGAGPLSKPCTFWGLCGRVCMCWGAGVCGSECRLVCSSTFSPASVVAGVPAERGASTRQNVQLALCDFHGIAPAGARPFVDRLDTAVVSTSRGLFNQSHRSFVLCADEALHSVVSIVSHGHRCVVTLHVIPRAAAKARAWSDAMEAGTVDTLVQALVASGERPIAQCVKDVVVGGTQIVAQRLMQPSPQPRAMSACARILARLHGAAASSSGSLTHALDLLGLGCASKQLAKLEWDSIYTAADGSAGEAADEAAAVWPDTLADGNLQRLTRHQREWYRDAELVADAMKFSDFGGKVGAPCVWLDVCACVRLAFVCD